MLIAATYILLFSPVYPALPPGRQHSDPRCLGADVPNTKAPGHCHTPTPGTKEPGRRPTCNISHEGYEGLEVQLRQRRLRANGNADHDTPQDGNEYYHKTPVPVVPPTCQHPLCTLCALVPPLYLCTLCPFVLMHNPCPLYLFVDLPLQKLTLPA